MLKCESPSKSQKLGAVATRNFRSKSGFGLVMVGIGFRVSMRNFLRFSGIQRNRPTLNAQFAVFR